ncbi:MAG: hypothetical protein JJ916_11570 [Phycisphaerales bacterium]|nr:hypothetical protein [Phycisphaerales bacterium]
MTSTLGIVVSLGPDYSPVLLQAEAKEREYERLEYVDFAEDPARSGCPEAIRHQGYELLESDDGVYCSGFTFLVVWQVLEEHDLLDNRSFTEMKSFRREWYGAVSGSREKTLVTALLNLGSKEAGYDEPLAIEIVELDEVRPGDFVQFWREESGHSAVVVNMIYRGGEQDPIGIRYLSAQGSTDGIGTLSEYFSDSHQYLSGDELRVANIDRDRSYFLRVLLD